MLRYARNDDTRERQKPNKTYSIACRTMIVEQGLTGGQGCGDGDIIWHTADTTQANPFGLNPEFSYDRE